MPPRKDFHTKNDIELMIISNDNENIIKTHPPVKPRTPRSQNINGNESLTADLLKIPTKKKVGVSFGCVCVLNYHYRINAAAFYD